MISCVCPQTSEGSCVYVRLRGRGRCAWRRADCNTIPNNCLSEAAQLPHDVSTGLECAHALPADARSAQLSRLGLRKQMVTESLTLPRPQNLRFLTRSLFHTAHPTRAHHSNWRGAGRCWHYRHAQGALLVHNDHAATCPRGAHHGDPRAGTAAAALRGGHGDGNDGNSVLGATAALRLGLLAVWRLLADEGAFGLGAVRGPEVKKCTQRT